MCDGHGGSHLSEHYGQCCEWRGLCISYCTPFLALLSHPILWSISLTQALSGCCRHNVTITSRPPSTNIHSPQPPCFSYPVGGKFRWLRMAQESLIEEGHCDLRQKELSFPSLTICVFHKWKHQCYFQ